MANKNMNDSEKVFDAAQTESVHTKEGCKTESQINDSSKKHQWKKCVTFLFVSIFFLGLCVSSCYNFYLSHNLALEIERISAQPRDVENINVIEEKILHQDAILNNVISINQKNEKAINAFSNKFEKLNRVTETLSNNVSQITQKIDGRNNEIAVWKIAEARFLTRMADRKLRIDHDYAVVADLLDEADKLILSLNDSRAYKLRMVYAKEITNLRSAVAFDYEGSALRLMSLAGNAQSIRVKQQFEDKLSQEELVVSDNISDWQENLLVTLQDFASKFIIVRSKNETDGVLLHPDNQIYVRENLRILLTSASLAVYRGDVQLFEAYRKQALELLDTYFDPLDNRVMVFKTTLTQITLPTIEDKEQDIIYLESVQLIEEFLKDVNTTRSAS